MKKLKLGIVGLGRGAGAGALIREQSKLIDVTAICDIDENRLKNVAARFGGADAGRSADSSNAGAPFAGETYLSFDEMLQKADIDAVYVATPIPAHADMVVQALNAGKHVVSEVICATTLEDCRRIKDAIRRSGKKYMMAEQYCFIRPWSIVMNMVKAGLFGEIYYAEGSYTMDFTRRPGYPYVGGWRQNIYHNHRGHVYITHSLGPLSMLFDEPLKYAETVCRRADEVGVKTVVFGSSGARNVPKDCKDVEKGVEQFTDFCRQLAARISDLKMCVVIEPLRPNESNIINYVWQGLQIVEDVKSPRIQQLADLFHMIMGRESPESIVQAGCRLKHVHIAEKETRQYPGKDDFDFSPYFNALKKIGYSGGISCECGWPNRKDKDAFYAARVKALAVMKKFAGQA